jgi:hypothetical protein
VVLEKLPHMVALPQLKEACMSFSDIPWWIYALLLWYACGIYTVGALFAAIVWDREPLPEDRHWGWLLALAGPFLWIYVRWLRPEDLKKGFVFTKRGAARLRKKVDRHYTCSR